MANFTRTLPTVTWTAGGMTLLPSHVADLDAKQFKMVNGDQGGMWTPTSTIDIGSTGLALTGPLRLGRGGKLRTNTASGARIKLNAGEWPLLEPGHAGRTRLIAQHVAPVRANGSGFQILTFPSSGLIQPLALALRLESQIGNVTLATYQPEWVIPLRVHDGSTLSNVSFRFRVPQRRTSVPLVPPRFRVVRFDKRTAQVYPVKTTADGTGYASPTNVQDAASWYAGGEWQTFDYAPDPGTVIDIVNNAYFTQTIEEQTDTAQRVTADGVFLRELKSVLVRAASFVNVGIGGLGTPVDGVTLSAGDLVLLGGQTDPRLNGIYEASTGYWVRAKGFDAVDDYTRPWLIRTQSTGFSSSRNGATIWECTTVGKLNRFDPLTYAANVEIRFAAPVGYGNIYSGCVTTFTNIVDMRWQ